MKNGPPRTLPTAILTALWSAALPVTFLAGCQTGAPSTDPADIESSKEALFITDSRLTVEAHFSQWAGTPRLYFGPENRRQSYVDILSSSCVAAGGLTKCNLVQDFNSTLGTPYGNLIEEEYDVQPKNDHQIVITPDDYDSIGLKNRSSSTDLVLEYIRIKVETKFFNESYNTNPDPYTHHQEFTYVDKEISEGRTIPAGKTFYLNDYIQQQRECVFKTALCNSATIIELPIAVTDLGPFWGDSDWCAASTATCSNGVAGKIPFQPATNPSPATIADVSLDGFPLVIRQAIKDLGEMGTTQWNVFNRNTGNSCYEPPGYLLKTYTNNLHTCDQTSPLCGDNDPQVMDINPERPCCTYFKYWHDMDPNLPDLYGRDGSAENFIWHDQFAAAGREARVLPDYYIDAAGNRKYYHGTCSDNAATSNYVICRTASNGSVYASLDARTSCSLPDGRIGSVFHYDCNTGKSYAPKAGDFFNIVHPNFGHVMLWAGIPPVVESQTEGGVTRYTFGGVILQGIIPFHVTFLGFDWNLIVTSNGALYFGEADTANSPLTYTQDAILSLGI